MHPLRYKQQRQLFNAVRRNFSTVRRSLTALAALSYGLISMLMIAAMVVVPIPPEVYESLQEALGPELLAGQLRTIQGSLTGLLMLIGSTAVFQNPLLRLPPADIDLLFATPIAPWRSLLGRILLNHARTLLAAYFFWGLAAVPVLRLFGVDPWPVGLWALAGLTCLLAATDQAVAYLQMRLLRSDPLRLRWMVRIGLIIFGLAAILLLAGSLVWMFGGGRAVFATTLAWLGSSFAAALLAPIGLANQLLLLPVLPGGSQPLPAFAALLALDLLSGWLLIGLVMRSGSGGLIEILDTPQLPRVRDLLRAAGSRPWLVIVALWSGDPGRVHYERAVRPSAIRGQAPALHSARAQIWRRLIELQRSAWRSGLALLFLSLLPLALYGPPREYSLSRLITVLIFSSILSTQLFDDAADHLRYADLELSVPVPRRRLLLAAFLPRLVLYWLGGVLLLIFVGLTSSGVRPGDLLGLAGWFAFLLISLISLRSMLVFLWPAAGNPNQRDPLQRAMIVVVNGLIAMAVIALFLPPIGMGLFVTNLLGIARDWLWPIAYLLNGMFAVVTVLLLGWSYTRLEPTEH
jgi:hypothetical protein